MERKKRRKGGERYMNNYQHIDIMSIIAKRTTFYRKDDFPDLR